MTLLSRKLLADLRAGRVRGFLRRIADPEVAPHYRPFFGVPAELELPTQVVDNIRGTHDSLLNANARIRLALRMLEVAHRTQGLPAGTYKRLRAQLNATTKEILRALPEALCELCGAADGRREHCKSCRGKGYHTLGDLKLA